MIFCIARGMLCVGMLCASIRSRPSRWDTRTPTALCRAKRVIGRGRGSNWRAGGDLAGAHFCAAVLEVFVPVSAKAGYAYWVSHCATVADGGAVADRDPVLSGACLYWRGPSTCCRCLARWHTRLQPLRTPATTTPGGAGPSAHAGRDARPRRVGVEPRTAANAFCFAGLANFSR